MKKKLIIFDCYGTLLTKSKGEAYSQFFQDNHLNIKTHYQTIMTRKDINWKDFIDLEKITEENYEKSVALFDKNIKEDIKNIKPYFEDLISYLDKLREKYVVVILSNLAKEYGEPIEKILSKHVDKVFLSYEIGFKKPQPEVFSLIKSWYEDNYGEIENKHIMIVDDSNNNINYIKTTDMLGININNGNLESPYSIKSFFEWILS